MEGAPDGDAREDQEARGRFALGQTEGGPDHDRSAQERNGIIACTDRKPTAENDFSDRDQRDKEQRLFAVPFPMK